MRDLNEWFCKDASKLNKQMAGMEVDTLYRFKIIECII